MFDRTAARAEMGLSCRGFVFGFVSFSFLIVVPSYLLVHSICTKKLD